MYMIYRQISGFFLRFVFFNKYGTLKLVINMNERVKRIVHLVLVADCVILLIYASFTYFIPFLNSVVHPSRYIKTNDSVLNVSLLSFDHGEAASKTISLPRGTKVQLQESSDTTSKVEYDGAIFAVDNANLATSLTECVDTEYVYPRRMINLFDQKDGELTDAVADKGEQLEVVSVSPDDLDVSTGVVKWYEVTKNDKTYWVPGAYVESQKALADKNYGSNIQYLTYWDEYYGSGYSKDAYIDQIDYKPMIKQQYEDNVMPDVVNAYHVSLSNLINHEQELLKLKDKSAINAFVVEIKNDDGTIFYDSQVAKKFLKNPQEAVDDSVSLEQLDALFTRFEDAGYYMIARIVTFKDPVFAKQNPKEAYTDQSGNLIMHDGYYWPSAFSRKAWRYNVALAMEIAPFVNEIQFDYVRFPDGTLQNSLDGTGDFHNKYDESKVAALQGFLSYAHTLLADQHVYVGADVFAWPVVSKDDQDIGQFLPALANVVDVVSPMPYLDHFSYGAMGIADPMSAPQETLYKFSSITKTQLDNLEYPARYRTWVQGYNVDAQGMRAQIDGIQDAGYDGYMIWAGNGDMEILETILPGLQGPAQ